MDEWVGGGGMWVWTVIGVLVVVLLVVAIIRRPGKNLLGSCFLGTTVHFSRGLTRVSPFLVKLPSVAMLWGANSNSYQPPTFFTPPRRQVKAKAGGSSGRG